MKICPREKWENKQSAKIRPHESFRKIFRKPQLGVLGSLQITETVNMTTFQRNTLYTKHPMNHILLNLNVYIFNELFSSLSMFLHDKRIIIGICIRENYPWEIFEDIKFVKLVHANLEKQWSAKINLPNVMSQVRMLSNFLNMAIINWFLLIIYQFVFKRFGYYVLTLVTFLLNILWKEFACNKIFNVLLEIFLQSM